MLYNLESKTRISKVISYLLLLLILLPPASALYSLSQPSSQYPVSTQIKVISYEGNDQAGVAALKAGTIQLYDYALTPQEVQSLGSSFYYLKTPSNFYDLVFNPVNTSFGFNPFMFQEVRQAMNYIVDRNYFVNSILGGLGIPTITPYGGELDEINVANATAAFSSFFNTNLTLANLTIYKVLTAHGAVLQGGKWYYGGKPITIYVFIRTDDPIREEYTKFFESQLQKLGFTIQEIPGNLNKANTVVYGSDPVNSTWDVYVEAWGGTYGYYDEGLAEAFTAPYFGTMPFSDTFSPASLSWGAFNDTKYERPSLISEGNQADQVALQLANTNFTNIQQRNALLNRLVEIGLNMSVRVYLAMQISPFAYSPSLKGLVPNFVEDPLNTMSYLTMSTSSGTPVVGVRYLTQGAFNPIGGFSDTYTVDLSAALTLPLAYPQPGNGYNLPVGITYKLLANSPEANYTVPPGALQFNYTTDKFYQLPMGTKAKTAVIVNFANLMQNDKWADGQPITLADIIYQYVVGTEVALNSNSSVFDSYASSIYSAALGQVIGFRIVNSTSLAIYSSTWYPDNNIAALTALGDMLAIGGALPGGNMFPWQLYVAMESVVAHKDAAWSKTASKSLGVDWLSLTNSKDLGYINSSLASFMKSAYIPPELIQLQNLTHVQLVNSTSAIAGYMAIVKFINTYGNAMISDGPYILSQYSPTTSPPFAVLTKSPYFNMGPFIDPKLFEAPSSLSAQASVPSVIPAGSPLTVSGQILETPAGTNQSIPAQGATVIVQVTGPSGLIYSTKAITGANGNFDVSVSPSILQIGLAYNVIIYYYTNSTILINPLTYSFVVLPPTTTTTSTSTTTTTTTSTSTSVATTTATLTATSTATTTLVSTVTTTSSSTLLIAAIAIVIIVIIAVVAVVLLRRR